MTTVLWSALVRVRETIAFGIVVQMRPNSRMYPGSDSSSPACGHAASIIS